MNWEIEELISKIERINELKAEGFNTPKFFFLEQGSNPSEIEKCMRWAEKTGRLALNIRNYSREGKMEGLNKPHDTDVSIGNLKEIVIKRNTHFHCMIDAEVPDNGRWAGNVVIETNAFGRPVSFTIEYCCKAIRAMVRDQDQSITLPLSEAEKYLSYPLDSVLSKAIKFSKKNVILEWTHFCEPAGIKDENLVWWEWRTA